MQDMVAIFTLNIFRLPVGLQVAIVNIVCLIFFGTNVARNGTVGDEQNFSLESISRRSCKVCCPF